MSAGRRCRAGEEKVGSENCAPLAGKPGAKSVQDCEDVLCLGTVGAVAGNERVSVVEDAVSVMEEDAEKNRVKDGLQMACWASFILNFQKSLRRFGG